MRDKIILGAMYSATGALGLWLAIDVNGILATIGGIGLLFFAGAGWAGMVTFGAAPISEVNAAKKINSRGATRASSLDALEFIMNELGVKIEVPNEIIEAASLNGQIVSYHFDTPFNRPSIFDPQRFKPYSPPVSIIGEFQVLLNYLRDIDDCNSETVIDAIGVAYKKYHKEYEFYPIELIFSDEQIEKVRERGDIRRDKDDLRANVADLVESLCQSALKAQHPREMLIGLLAGAHGGLEDKDEYQALMSEVIRMAEDGVPLDQLAEEVRRAGRSRDIIED